MNKYTKDKIFKIKHRRAYEFSKKVGNVSGFLLLGLLLILSLFGKK